MSLPILEDLVNVHSVVRNLLSIQAVCSGEGVQRTIYTGILNLYEGVIALCEASEIVPSEVCDKLRSKLSDLQQISETVEEDSENHCRGITRIVKNPLKSFRTWRKAARFELDSLAMLAEIKKTAVKCYLKKTALQVQTPSPAVLKEALGLESNRRFERVKSSLDRYHNVPASVSSRKIRYPSIPMATIAFPAQAAQ